VLSVRKLRANGLRVDCFRPSVSQGGLLRHGKALKFLVTRIFEVAGNLGRGMKILVTGIFECRGQSGSRHEISSDWNF
jgi:hypothetical protein